VPRPPLVSTLAAATTLALAVVSLAGRREACAQGKDLEGVVNLNTATPELLELLPGVGPAKVRDILLYRRRRPFRTIDELVRIKGIGRKMVRRLREHLAVSGPTTAHAVRRTLELEPPPSAPPPPQARKPPLPPPARPHPKGPRAPETRPARADHCARPP
jgi:competence protein ComEA